MYFKGYENSSDMLDLLKDLPLTFHASSMSSELGHFLRNRDLQDIKRLLQTTAVPTQAGLLPVFRVTSVLFFFFNRQ